MIASQVIRGRGAKAPMMGLTGVSIAPTTISWTEQVLIGDSVILSETPGKAETVIITNT